MMPSLLSAVSSLLVVLSFSIPDPSRVVEVCLSRCDTLACSTNQRHQLGCTRTQTNHVCKVGLQEIMKGRAANNVHSGGESRGWKLFMILTVASGLDAEGKIDGTSDEVLCR